MVPFDRQHMISYYYSIVTVSILHHQRDIITYFVKLKEVTWSEHIPFMHARFLTVTISTWKSKCLASLIPKMIGAKLKNGSH